MVDKTGRVVVCLRIASVVYFIATVIYFFISIAVAAAGEALLFVLLFFVSVFCLGMGVLCEVTIRGLRKKRRWAWIVSLVLACIFLISIYLPMGIVMLFALFDDKVRRSFRI